MDTLIADNPTVKLNRLRELEDKGIKEIIRVVEVKSDEDQEDVIRAKEKYGIDHFNNVNNRLRNTNPIDFPEDFQLSMGQYYTFDLLTPEKYSFWFSNLRNGNI